MIDTKTRMQVRAAIIATMNEAAAQGRCPMAAAERTYPGTPLSVLGECFAEHDDQQTEAWWRSVERTIDGEVIRNAVAQAAIR